VNKVIFATITSGGTLSLWNLGKSTVEPFDSFTVAKVGRMLQIEGLCFD
jgi:hypothetical protein